MTTEEFWKIYLNNNVVENFDIIYDFFSKKLPKEFVKEYDVGEVILETFGHNESAKEFGNVLKFIELIQTKHPKLYRKYSKYFDNFLVDYYIFHKNTKEAEKVFSNFLDDTEECYDDLLLSLKKLVFYQNRDVPDKTINRIFNTIKNSGDLVGGAETDLAMYKFDINLEKFYVDATSGKAFEKEKFSDSLVPYDFKVPEITLAIIEKGLFDLSFKLELDSFAQDQKNCLLTAKYMFLREMSTKKFSFILSGFLWDELFEFWEKKTHSKKQQPDDYFFINTDKFEHYLADLSGNYFVDNQPNMIAVLWGSVYIYDFLLSIGFISQKIYDSFQYTSKVLKGKVIGQFTCELWNSNFIHQWTKPDSISINEFSEEEKIFLKSFSLKPVPFFQLKSEISEELENIGDLSEFILKGGVSKKRNFKFKDLFKPDEEELESGGDIWESPSSKEGSLLSTSSNFGKKPSRNAPCPCGSGKKYKKCCGK